MTQTQSCNALNQGGLDCSRPGMTPNDSQNCLLNNAVVTKTSTNPLPQPNQIGISRMLFLVCTVFIILNLPSYVTRMYMFVYSLTDDIGAISPLTLLLHKYFMLLYYTNFAINFLLYN